MRRCFNEGKWYEYVLFGLIFGAMPIIVFLINL